MSNRFQLWSRDEYGQGSIIKSSDDILELVDEAKKQVTNINMNNALTTDDKLREWDAYMVEPFVPDGDNDKNACIVYGGKSNHNEDVVYLVDKEEDTITTYNILDFKNNYPIGIKIYIGEDNNKEYYGKNRNAKDITSLSEPILSEKTYFFIKKI